MLSEKKMLKIVFLLSTLFITVTLFYKGKCFYETVAFYWRNIFSYISHYSNQPMFWFLSALGIKVIFIIFLGTLDKHFLKENLVEVLGIENKTLYNTKILKYFIELYFHRFHIVFFWAENFRSSLQGAHVLTTTFQDIERFLYKSFRNLGFRILNIDDVLQDWPLEDETSLKQGSTRWARIRLDQWHSISNPHDRP